MEEMSAADARPKQFQELELAIRRRINERTGGHIQMLKVALIDDRIVISGIAFSYYHKQLAVQGALDVTAARPEYRIELNIDVISLARDEVTVNLRTGTDDWD